MAIVKAWEEFDISKVEKFFSNDRYIRNKRISDDTLKAIYDDFCNSYNRELEDIKNEILNELNKQLPEKVHSIRGRVKNPYHLIEKIIRNHNNKPEKYNNISVENYNKLITDLIGIRIIILDKRDWIEVHECLKKMFIMDSKYYIKDSSDLISNFDKYSKMANSKDHELENSYNAEKPKVYITTSEDRELYDNPDLDCDNSKSHYRSIHYIIRYKNVYFEIQVRTLFEEGWLEFDHRTRYPYNVNNLKLKEYIGVLNSLAQSADQLISFYDENMFKLHNEESNNKSYEEKKSKEKTGDKEGKISLAQRLIDEF